MRARSSLLLSVVVVTLIGCNRSNPPSTNPADKQAGAPQATGKVDPNADVGPELFRLAGPPKYSEREVRGSETIVIPNCYVQYEDRQQVSAEVDGKIDLIASPLSRRPDGHYEWKQADGTMVVYEPARPHPSIVFHPRDRAAFPNDKSKWVPGCCRSCNSRLTIPDS